MKVPEWMDENVFALWDQLFRLQVSIQVLTEYLKDAYPKRFERADGKRYVMRTISVPMPVSDLKNKHTVYYKQKRSYHCMRPLKKIPRLENESIIG